jgi:hypothetical protein
MRARRPPLVLALFIWAGTVLADPVVIVSTRSGIDQLSREEVINIFLGRYRTLPGGVNAVPVDQPDNSALRAEFYRRLVNKEPSEIKAYWSRLVFSGKTSPPLQAGSPSEALALVVAQPQGVGYADRAQVDHRFRVVLELSR